MKKQDIYRELSNIDPELIAEADPNAPRVSAKNRFWRKFTLIAACALLVTTFACLWLFLPYDRADEDLGALNANNLPSALKDHADSEYLDLMLAFYKFDKEQQNVNRPNNNFENYIADMLNSFFDIFEYKVGSGAVRDDAPMAPGATDDFYYKTEDGELGNYVETTDNQVAGVIEADLFKRTTTHIFYLNRSTMVLKVYSIEGEESRLVSEYKIDHGYENMFSELYSAQIFLSEDGKTLTVLGSGMGYTENEDVKKKLSLAMLISLDVSNPEKIEKKAHFSITGDYLSARLVDGKILLMSKYYVGKIDYDDELSFLPQIDTGAGFEVMAAEDIIFPEKLTSKCYTVVTQVDMETLALEGAAGCLCYSENVYVSADKVFLTRDYNDYFEGEDDGVKYVENKNVTEIFALGYGEGGFAKLGRVSVDGRVKDQYSLDEYEGVLRVVTTTNGTKYIGGDIIVKDGVIETDGDTFTVNSGSNAALFCIDLESFEIIGEVRDFAPDGETVESVRFDGTNAYVCTAVVITFTDPVYFFDLSDMSNITYTDTGVIDGYSSSLVNFGDGFLLGIGYGANRATLKIEVYVENGDKVESVAAYEREYCSFSEDYKSYFIDRERGLVGLMVEDTSNVYMANRYILLAFDGYKLVEVVDENFGDIFLGAGCARAALADDYLYIMFFDEFKAVKIYN